MKLFDFLLKSRQMKREVEDPANYTWVNPHLPPDIVTISRADYDKLMANQRKVRKSSPLMRKPSSIEKDVTQILRATLPSEDWPGAEQLTEKLKIRNDALMKETHKLYGQELMNADILDAGANQAKVKAFYERPPGKFYIAHPQEEI